MAYSYNEEIFHYYTLEISSDGKFNSIIEDTLYADISFPDSRDIRVSTSNWLENQLSKVDTGFTNVPFIEELINQPFFSEITFWDIDTVAVVRTGTSGRKQAITIAVDRKDKIYRISGFGHINEYNKIIEQYPIQIYENNITNICEFYIFLHRGSTRDELYFVNNINKFIKLNKSIMVDSLGYYHPEKNMDNVASRISNVLRNEQFNNSLSIKSDLELFLITLPCCKLRSSIKIIPVKKHIKREYQVKFTDIFRINII